MRDMRRRHGTNEDREYQKDATVQHINIRQFVKAQTNEAFTMKRNKILVVHCMLYGEFELLCIYIVFGSFKACVDCI